MFFFEFEKYFIMVIGFALLIIEILMYRKRKNPIKILYMIIGLFWGIFMLISIIHLTPESMLNLIIGRSGTLFSISVVFATALRNWRRIKG